MFANMLPYFPASSGVVYFLIVVCTDGARDMSMGGGGATGIRAGEMKLMFDGRVGFRTGEVFTFLADNDTKANANLDARVIIPRNDTAGAKWPLNMLEFVVPLPGNSAICKYTALVVSIWPVELYQNV